MRAKIWFFFVINIAIVVFLVSSVWTLLELLVVDGSDDAISRAELPAPNSEMIDGRPQLIPKIIHQTYVNSSIPLVWQGAQQSCIDLHSDYEYKLWTDDISREFINKEYPWFIDTWDGYQFPIQRADAIRYFVLAHYGGIYIDLDDGCQRRLDPLLSYPAWARRTKPTGISNDVMGSIPGHPFFLYVIEKLEDYNRNWFSPYITIMSSTGPLFLSLMWRHYLKEEQPEQSQRLRIVFPDAYMGHKWSFFTHHVGNSWHKWDTELIIWMGRHWVELTVMGFAIAGVVFAAIWLIYHRVFLVNGPRPSRSLYRRLPFFRRRSGQLPKERIELSNRHLV